NRSQFENFDAWGVEHDFLSILEPVSVASQLQLGTTLAAGRSGGGESGIGRVGRIGDEDAKQNHPGTENESPRPVSPRLRVSASCFTLHPNNSFTNEPSFTLF